MLVEALIVLTTAGIAGACLAMAGFAVRAYANSKASGLVPLAVGFTLVVGAVVSASTSAILTDFEGIRTILAFQTLLTFAGYVVIGYAVYSFRGSDANPGRVSDHYGR